MPPRSKERISSSSVSQSAPAARLPRRLARILNPARLDRKSTRLNSSHTEIYTLSLHDALPIYAAAVEGADLVIVSIPVGASGAVAKEIGPHLKPGAIRSEEHTSELQSHRDLHSFPTRRSSDLCRRGRRSGSRHRQYPSRRQRRGCQGDWPAS